MLAMTPSRLALDFDVYASRQVELHQGVERLRCRFEDVEQAFVGADLELLAGLLVHVRTAQHRVAPDGGGERNGPGDARARASCCLDDVRRRFVEQLVIEGFESDPD